MIFQNQCYFLFNLPREIRDRIYEYVLEPGHTKDLPVEPALTKVCEMIREEALDVFYAIVTCPLAVSLHPYAGYTHFHRPYRRIPAARLARARNFTIVFEIRHLHDMIKTSVVINISFLKPGAGFRLYHELGPQGPWVPSYGDNSMKWRQDAEHYGMLFEYLKRHLTKVLDAVVRRERFVGLTVEDVDHLLDVKAEGLPVPDRPMVGV